MILDRINNRTLYETWRSGVAEALDYLAKTDFQKMPDGKYELDGERLFAIVQRYRPKPLAEIVWETHRNYIDIQYVAEGVERMGYAPLGDHPRVKQDYDPQLDAIFYEAQGDFFIVPAGSFVVFTPRDIHAPALAVDSPDDASEVLKVVVKCLFQ